MNGRPPPCRQRGGRTTSAAVGVRAPSRRIRGSLRSLRQTAAASYGFPVAAVRRILRHAALQLKAHDEFNTVTQPLTSISADDEARASAPAPVGYVPKANDEPEYTCPMHPEVRQRGPGNCPKCGMTLERVTPVVQA